MYAYLTPDNVVGQQFEVMPADGLYHPDFMARIVQLPEGVVSGYIYDSVTDTFSAPAPEQMDPTTEEIILELLADHEYRLCLSALGLEGGASNGSSV